MNERTKNKVMKYVENALRKDITVYYGNKNPKWIRDKIDAKAGDTVTVSVTKPSKYGIVNKKRVYNSTILIFDGEKWIVIDGGRK